MCGWSLHPHRASGVPAPGVRRIIFCTSWLPFYPVRAKLTSPFFTFYARSPFCFPHGAGWGPIIFYCRVTVRRSQVWGCFCIYILKYVKGPSPSGRSPVGRHPASPPGPLGTGRAAFATPEYAGQGSCSHLPVQNMAGSQAPNFFL